MWEYLVVSMHVEVLDQQVSLAERAKEGWELITVVESPTSGPRAYWRRAVS